MLAILWRRRMYPLGGAAAIGLLSLIYLLFAKQVYTVTSSILVQPIKLATLAEMQMQTPTVSENYLNTEAELITSTPTLALALAMPNVDKLKTLDDVDDRLSYLKKKLDVEVGKKNDLISVSLETTSPVEGTMLVNSVVNAYINYQANQMKTSTTSVLNVLKGQMDSLNDELANKRQQLSDFRRQNNTMSLGDDKNNIQQERLTKLSDALTEADVEVLNAKSAMDTATTNFKSDPDKMARLKAMQADSINLAAVDEASLKAGMFDLNQRLRDMSRQYMPNHPLVQATRLRLDQMELAYMTLMQQRYTSAVQKRDELKNAVDDLNKQAIEQSDKATQYQRLLGDVRRLETLEDQLDDRIKNTDVTKNAGAMNITIVDEASLDEDHPPHPRKATTLAGGLILGLALGVVAGFVREYTDRSLKSAVEIEKSLGLPVLGAFPSMPRQYSASTHARAVHLNPGSDAAESVRSLRSALMMNASARKFKTFLVTSPIEGDGKTTIACNLAIALAKSGSRTLLVDTNLRDPSIHAVFGLVNDRGLSSVLSGDAEGNTIQPSGLSNLDVLPAGPLLDEPADLLNSPLLTETMVQLSRMYDMVIVDAAPVLPVVDGRIVAASCDASILVLNSRRTEGKLSTQACEGLLSVGAEVLGIVVNDVAPDRLGDGFDVSYAHLGGYSNERMSGSGQISDSADRARS